ncbi:DNA replication protein DnaD [Planococcus massiliensis]|uniref:DNA replication protein DnaD n=1 Tax=Planococcus massiliensis TaxID=1499687 RepID=A0A098EK14_9BACL|nr:MULTISPECIES: DnaD domain-containing protein [Planococcus]MCJ1907393.1 DnaD domain-containing protein [Planococcus ruber]CEG22628.1 DNA replication protein DnaD [Planococcus massiliensis]
MKQPDRLQTWIEQGNVAISQLFFRFYKELKITDEEAMLIMHVHAFLEAGNPFPTPDEIGSRMMTSQNHVTTMIQKLMQQGYLAIEQDNDKELITEHISLQPLWERLLDCVYKEKQEEKELSQKALEGEVFQLFEQEFGRFLSPMEIETISMWMDQDGHSPAIIRMALKEAVISQKISLRYVDRILFEWKKKNIKTSMEVSRHATSFREKNIQLQPAASTTKKVQFYNWLEERN